MVKGCRGQMLCSSHAVQAKSFVTTWSDMRGSTFCDRPLDHGGLRIQPLLQAGVPEVRLSKGAVSLQSL